MKIISMGEILWDVLDHEECLGGAPFNFAVDARRLGHDVFLSAPLETTSVAGAPPCASMSWVFHLDLSSR